MSGVCGRTFRKDQWIEVMRQAAARQEIRPVASQFAGRTAAQNKPPPRFFFIVKILHRIKDGRDRLGFVYKYKTRQGFTRQGTANLNELFRIGKVAGTFPWIGQIDLNGIRWKNGFDECGFPRLSSPE